MNRKLLIIGGGTGGHISPGIAIYETAVEKKAGVKFLTGKRDKRFKYLSEINREDLFYYGAPAFTKNPLKLPVFLIKFILSVLKVKKFINKNGITDIIGMGGYVSAPALLAAKSMKINIWLCEQNVVPGKVTRMFARSANSIFTTFESTDNYIDLRYKEKLVCAGNPIRKQVIEEIGKKEAKKRFNLPHCKKVILVIGGSQGAVQINEMIFQLLLNYKKDFRDIGFIWCTGQLSFEKYKNLIRENDLGGSVYLSPFVEEVGIAYSACDLAVSRSGSGVMVELAAMGVPSILIPYPYAADNHQSKNADEFAQVNASLKIEGKEIDTDVLAKTLLKIMNNKSRYEAMKRSTLKMAKIKAAEDILSKIGVI